MVTAALILPGPMSVVISTAADTDATLDLYEAGRLLGESWVMAATFAQLDVLLANSGAWRKQLDPTNAFGVGWMDGALAAAETIDEEPTCSLERDG